MQIRYNLYIMTSLNTSSHLGKINAGLNAWQGKRAEAESDMQNAILGNPSVSSGTLRQNLHVAAQVLAFLRENHAAWLQEAKEEARMRRELLNLDGRTDLATA